MVVSTVLLTANFYSHTLSTLSIDRFLNNEFPSERYVITRIALSEDRGLAYGGGFMANHAATDALFKATDKEPYKDFRRIVHKDAAGLSPYVSHLGVQDDVLYPVWKGLFLLRDAKLAKAKEGSRWQERLQHYDLYYVVKGTQFAVALINALAISLLLAWAAKEVSAGAAYLSLALVMVLLPDLTFFGRSMWWLMATWFLPFLVFAWAYRRNGGAPLGVAALVSGAVLAGAFLSLKTAMGYEFTSTVMVAALIPATYYAVKNGWALKRWIGQCFVIGVFQLAGFALTLYLHYQSLAAIGEDPLAVLENRFQMRAYGGDGAAGEGTAIAESTGINVLAVYARHLFGFQDLYLPRFVLLLPLLFWLWNRRAAWRSGFSPAPQERALLAAIALGFFGALSMYTILKGHAFVHGFDVVAFSIPMNVMLCVFYARWIWGKAAARPDAFYG